MDKKVRVLLIVNIILMVIVLWKVNSIDKRMVTECATTSDLSSECASESDVASICSHDQ